MGEPLISKTLYEKHFRWKQPLSLVVHVTKDKSCSHWYDGLMRNGVLSLGQWRQVKDEVRLEKKQPGLTLKSANMDSLIFSSDDGRVVLKIRESTKTCRLEGTLRVAKDKRKYYLHIHHEFIWKITKLRIVDPSADPEGKYV